MNSIVGRCPAQQTSAGVHIPRLNLTRGDHRPQTFTATSTTGIARRGEVLVGICPHHAHDPMDAAIKFLCRGQGTHAFFLRGNGRIVESFWPYLRERDFEPGERETIEFYSIMDSDAADWARLEAEFDRELSLPVPPMWLCCVMQIPGVSRRFRRRAGHYRPIYSIRDLFRYALDMPPVPGRDCFCSMWVLRLIRLCLAPGKQILVRLQYRDFAPPSQLRSSPRLFLVKSSL